MSEFESTVRLFYSGMVSARWHQFNDGEQVVIVYFGSSAVVHMPYNEALVLLADLNAAMAQFDNMLPGAAVADWERVTKPPNSDWRRSE